MLKESSWNIDIEKKILKKWENERGSKQHNIKGKKPFVIDTPPPYPSGRPWHIGAAAHYSQIDMIARTSRLFGNDVYFPIGLDRNGLPVERYTEKKNNIKMHETPREKFIELCSHALDDLENEMLGIMKNMGMSCDFKNYYRTDSAEYRALTQATFIELWHKGLVYEAMRPNNYCIDCGTTIADAEIAYKELPTQLIYVKFKLENGKDLVVATTRPELLCSCQVVMVNPADDRYKDVVGKNVTIPVFGRKVKIISHPYAKQEFGSGVVMMCSYGDYSDVRIFRELGLKEIIAIDEHGKMIEAAENYKGLSIKDARFKIIEDLEKMNLIERKEQIMHRTPICERSNTPIEIIPMNEFYLKQLEFTDKMRQFARKMKFFPEMHRQILLNWIDSVAMDWPISRRRYYGTEIPIWYCKKCGKANLPKPGRYYKPWKDKPPFNKCKFCDGKEFKGEERTFDTWMDSSISPLFISKYDKDDKFFKKTFPNSIRPQGKEIIRTWLYYTLLRCFQLTGKCAFENVWVMGWGVDEKGERMSKSKGNVIDPIPLLERYGGDAFRFWAASEATLGSDFRCSEQRIESASKFISKLWNIARFISSFADVKKPSKLHALDIFIMNELEKVKKECMKGYSNFNFFIPSNALRDFVWNAFASHYIELVKSRAYGKDASASYTLNKCFREILILLSPLMPFSTDFIYGELYNKSVFEQKFPKIEKTIKMELTIDELSNLDSIIWKAKKDKGMSLKAEVKKAVLPSKFRSISNDIKTTHNISILKFGESIEIELM